MGLDIKFQAIPEDCALLEGARQKPEWAESIASLKNYSKETSIEVHRKLNHGPELINFGYEAFKTIQANPGLEKRNLFWGRYWDMVHYLLSGERRGYTPSLDDTLIKRVIMGGEPLPTKAAEDGYVPAHYLSVVEVRHIADLFNSVKREDMYQHYDIEAMNRKGIYKFVQIPQDDRGFVEIYNKFLELKDFYNLVAEHKESIVSQMF